MAGADACATGVVGQAAPADVAVLANVARSVQASAAVTALRDANRFMVDLSMHVCACGAQTVALSHRAVNHFRAGNRAMSSPRWRGRSDRNAASPRAAVDRTLPSPRRQ